MLTVYRASLEVPQTCKRNRLLPSALVSLSRDVYPVNTSGLAPPPSSLPIRPPTVAYMIGCPGDTEAGSTGPRLSQSQAALCCYHLLLQGGWPLSSVVSDRQVTPPVPWQTVSKTSGPRIESHVLQPAFSVMMLLFEAPIFVTVFT